MINIEYIHKKNILQIYLWNVTEQKSFSPHNFGLLSQDTIFFLYNAPPHPILPLPHLSINVFSFQNQNFCWPRFFLFISMLEFKLNVMIVTYFLYYLCGNMFQRTVQNYERKKKPLLLSWSITQRHFKGFMMHTDFKSRKKKTRYCCKIHGNSTTALSWI